MTDSAIQAKAVKTMITINAAIRNIRLYPTTSASTKMAIEKAFANIESIFTVLESFVFAESEGNMLICDRPLDEKERKTPQVTSFLDLLTSFELKSLTLKKGMTIEEFSILLDSMSRKPSDFKDLGGLKAALEKQDLPHILLDQKIYVAMNKDEEITKIGEKSAGIAKEHFNPMISALDDLLEPECIEIVAQQLAGSIAKKSNDVVAMVLGQSLTGKLSHALFTQIVAVLDNERFQQVADEMRATLIEAESNRAAVAAGDLEALKTAWQNLKNTEKGAVYHERIKQLEDEEKAKKEAQRTQITAGIQSILKGETTYLGDSVVLEAIPKTIEQLVAKDKAKSAYAILKTVCDGMTGDDPSARRQTPPILSGVCESLELSAHQEFLYQIAQAVAVWFKNVAEYTPAQDAFATLIERCAKNMIAAGDHANVHKILTVFSQIRLKTLPKPDKMASVAQNLLQKVASDEILDPLIKEFQTNENQQRQQVIPLLILLGDQASSKLIESLRVSTDKSERSRILQLVGEIGIPALPVLIERLAEGKPWFFMRNLILLLGKIGGQSQVELIRPYCKYYDFRVQIEAINSIYQISPAQREDIFIEELAQADDRVKINIIEFLGQLKSEKSVPLLLAQFNTDSRLRNDIALKVCMALGEIGAVEAAPYLRKIVEPQKAGGDEKPFDDNVKKAAKTAFIKISEMKKKGERPKDAGKIEPAAQSAPVDAAPLIRELKSAQLDKNYPEKWPKLFSPLSQEETAALLSALIPLPLTANTVLYRQGDLNPRLFLIDDGELSLSFRHEDQDILIRKLTAGDIIGYDTFFNISVCTATLKAVTDASLSRLELNALEQWKTNVPALSAKLRDYCLTLPSLAASLEQQALDRRLFKRMNHACKVAATLIDQRQQPEKNPLSGELININAGGVAFSTNAPQEVLATLLQQRLNLEFTLQVKKQPYKINAPGSVTAVNFLSANNYSVHVKFDKLLALLTPKKK